MRDWSNSRPLPSSVFPIAGSQSGRGCRGHVCQRICANRSGAPAGIHGSTSEGHWKLIHNKFATAMISLHFLNHSSVFNRTSGLTFQPTDRRLQVCRVSVSRCSCFTEACSRLLLKRRWSGTQIQRSVSPNTVLCVIERKQNYC